MGVPRLGRLLAGVRYFGSVAGALLLANCGGHKELPPDAGLLPGIQRAAVPEFKAESVPLTAVRTDPARFVAWTTSFEDMRPLFAYTFKEPVRGTINNELLEFCQTYVSEEHPTPEQLTARLEQLLGLRPGDGTGRVVIEMKVPKSQLFRPCPDPAIDTPSCPIRFNREELKKALDKDPTASRFLLEQIILSYQETGYPFTRLGYTYDWAESSAERHHVGLSEYVLKPDTSAMITSQPLTAAQYCGLGN
jgi:hypothetical protein